ncbi:MAG: A/G-specific adenine glycosylase, partial [Bacteroidota bacterium]
MPINPAYFTTALIEWYDPGRRPLAWKHISDPYLIWLSEIILQQTRAEQGAPYFEKFKAAFPTVAELALAPEDQVMKLWEGLGYYSRARNLHAAAKFIYHELEGQFPSTYPDILQLKGVGSYTAAAIASFAYGLPHAVVDGNVYRVLSRFYGETTPIDTTTGKKRFAQLAQQLLAIDDPAIYNQAIMDLGATICTPKAPKCSVCPMADECQAYAENTWHALPVKVKKLQRKTRYFNFLVLQHPTFRVIQKRTAKDIWQNLYQFPLLETTEMIDDWSVLAQKENWPDWLAAGQIRVKRKVGPNKQELTHQRIIAQFWELDYLSDDPPTLPD